MLKGVRTNAVTYGSQGDQREAVRSGLPALRNGELSHGRVYLVRQIRDDRSRLC